MRIELEEVQKIADQYQDRFFDEISKADRLQREIWNLEKTHRDELKTVEDLLETVQAELTDTRLLLRQLAFDGSTDEAIKRIERFVKKGE